MKKAIFLVVCFCSVFSCKALENNMSVEYLDNVYSNRVINGLTHIDNQGIYIKDGKVIYSITPSKNYSESAYNELTDVEFKGSDLEYFELISYFGYGYPGHDDYRFYLASQELIWEKLYSNSEFYFTNGLDNSNKIDLEYYKNEILSLINDYKDLPDVTHIVYSKLGQTFIINDSKEKLNRFETDSSFVQVDQNSLVYNTYELGDFEAKFKLKDVNIYNSVIYESESSTSFIALGTELLPSFNININVTNWRPVKFYITNYNNETKEFLINNTLDFKIKNLNTGKYVSYNNSEIFTVGESGNLEFDLNMAPGDYEVEVIKNPQGYEQVYGNIIFHVKDSEGQVTEVINFYSKLKKYDVNISVVGEEINKIIQDGTYKTIYSYIPLDGIGYELIAAEDIIIDGNVIYFKNQLIGYYTTSKGNINIFDLYDGKYYLNKTGLPNEYEVNDDIYYISSDKYKYTLVNHLKKYQLEITTTNGNVFIPNTDIVVLNEKNEIILETKTDEYGKVVIEDLPFGQYYVYEKNIDSKYILNTDIYSAFLAFDSTIQIDNQLKEIVPDYPSDNKGDNEETEDKEEKPVIPDDSKDEEKPVIPDNPNEEEKQEDSKNEESKEDNINNGLDYNENIEISDNLINPNTTDEIFKQFILLFLSLPIYLKIKHTNYK